MWMVLIHPIEAMKATSTRYRRARSLSIEIVATHMEPRMSHTVGETWPT